VVYAILYGTYKLVPMSLPCPSCGKRLQRSHKWRETTYSYPCDDCKVRWDTGLRVSD
jgi:predicted  nucleic acid-binding Zn ribbon protein